MANNECIMNLVDAGSEINNLEELFALIEINFKSSIRMLHYFLSQLKRSIQA